MLVTLLQIEEREVSHVSEMSFSSEQLNKLKRAMEKALEPETGKEASAQ